MKLLNKTLFTTALIATFALGQPVLADTPDHNQAAQGVSISNEKQHAIQDAIFGDEANHNGYSGGHYAGDHNSHGGHSAPKFSSAEHKAIQKLIFGNSAQGK